MHGLFGRYRLLERLAVGGMAEIFLAEQEGSSSGALNGISHAPDNNSSAQKRVVVKRILPHLSADADFVKMFIDEALLAAQVQHPNIVQILDFGSVAQNYYIAMEYVDGFDLYRLGHLLRPSGAHLSPSQVAKIGYQAALGLHHVHTAADPQGQPLGIVHRDISPHNLIISTDGAVKITDFGIAKAQARLSRTATGTLKGKLGYMAPELLEGTSATPQADQYSLGVVLFEALTGRPLYTKDNERDLIAHKLAGTLPDLFISNPSSPEAEQFNALLHIICGCLARQAADRYADLQALAYALQAFLTSCDEIPGEELGLLITEAKALLAARPQSDWSWAHPQTGQRTLPAAPPPLTARLPRLRTEQRQAPPRRKLSLRIKVPLLASLAALAAIAVQSTLLAPRAPSLAFAVPLPEASPAAAGPNTAAPAPPAGETPAGEISLSSEGLAFDVYLASTHLGRTPLRHVSVPAGMLQIALVSPSSPLRRYQRVFVPPGGHTQLKLSAP